MYVYVHSLLQIFVSIQNVQSILYIFCPPEAGGIDDRKTKLSNATNEDHLVFQNDGALKHISDI